MAVADTERSRCERSAPGIPAYPSAYDIVAAGEVDALVVATPASAHVDVARLASEAGLTALVEKPPAVDMQGTMALVELRPAPWIGFNRRFEPATASLRSELEGSAKCDLALELYYRRRSWRSYVVADDALLDIGPHLIDLARWLTGAEIRRARARRLDHERAVFELDLESGRVHISCATDRVHRERISARDASGRRVAQLDRGGLIRGVVERIDPSASGQLLVESLSRQLEALASAAHGEPPAELGTATDGLAVMGAIEAVRRSSQLGGRWQAVARPAPAIAS